MWHRGNTARAFASNDVMGSKKRSASPPKPLLREAFREPLQSPGHLEERLDEALEETFPASDPIAVDPSTVRRVRPPAR